jgi:hypothetical protein
MIMFVIQYQSHRAGTVLRRELVACLLAHGPTFSRVGASGKPGAVHSADGIYLQRSTPTSTILHGEGAVA